MTITRKHRLMIEAAVVVLALGILFALVWPRFQAAQLMTRLEKQREVLNQMLEVAKEYEAAQAGADIEKRTGMNLVEKKASSQKFGIWQTSNNFYMAKSMYPKEICSGWQEILDRNGDADVGRSRFISCVLWDETNFGGLGEWRLVWLLVTPVPDRKMDSGLLQEITRHTYRNLRKRGDCTQDFENYLRQFTFDPTNGLKSAGFQSVWSIQHFSPTLLPEQPRNK